MDLSAKTNAVTLIQSHIRGWLLRKLLFRTFAEYKESIQQSLNFTSQYGPGKTLKTLWIDHTYDEKLAKYVNLQTFISEAESQQTLE